MAGNGSPHLGHCISPNQPSSLRDSIDMTLSDSSAPSCPCKRRVGGGCFYIKPHPVMPGAFGGRGIFAGEGIDWRSHATRSAGSAESVQSTPDKKDRWDTYKASTWCCELEPPPLLSGWRGGGRGVRPPFGGGRAAATLPRCASICKNNKTGVALSPDGLCFGCKTQLVPRAHGGDARKALPTLEGTPNSSQEALRQQTCLLCKPTESSLRYSFHATVRIGRGNKFGD